MRDSNLPKFLAADARLFDAIVADLFPGMQLPEKDHGALQTELHHCAAASGLQPSLPFLDKCVQLFETLNVRFGVMLVGPAAGGKTAIRQTLRDAVTCLRDVHEHPLRAFQHVTSTAINPKAVSTGELYGAYSRVTNEWSDGLASSLIRTAAADPSGRAHWVVFDGPVDAGWVESMNTVLDDNCLLCLPNGERVKLNADTMRMLFEVADLAVASPATVSRCGMVYVPAESTGWRSYVASWVARLPAALSAVPGETHVISPTLLSDLEDMFEAYVDTGLAWVRLAGKEDVPSVDMQLVSSLCLWLQALLRPAGGFESGEAYGAPSKVALGYIFAFSYVWGLGGNLNVASWDAWDVAVRKQFHGVANFPPGTGTVFDYCLDPQRNFAIEVRAGRACAVRWWTGTDQQQA